MTMQGCDTEEVLGCAGMNGAASMHAVTGLQQVPRPQQLGRWHRRNTNSCQGHITRAKAIERVRNKRDRVIKWVTGWVEYTLQKVTLILVLP